MADEKSNSPQSEGGKARAKALDAETRSAIAKRAALMRWGDGIMKATHMGELPLGGLKVPCAVLEDGSRVVSLTGLAELLGGRPGGREYRAWRENGSGELPVFLSNSAIKPYLSRELTDAAEKPIKYRPAMGGPLATGLPAEVLPQVCEAWLDARSAGVLSKALELRAKKAEIVLRSFAKVGVIALIDEATGYQEVRSREALQALLEKYIGKELSAWAKRFPDEFYREMYKLRGWEWKGVRARPQCVAQYTKDVVYERLAPGILKELEAKNPVENGRRRARHHQWLTTDVGHPALSQHMHTVINFMKISKTWEQFKGFLDTALPRKGDTLKLFPNE